MKQPAPSLKRLTTLLKDVDCDTAKLIRMVIHSKTRQQLIDLVYEYEAMFIRTSRLISSCFNMPGRIELAGRMLDELLHTCGLEYLFKSERLYEYSGVPVYCDSIPVTIYCNAGDPYATTLLYYRGRWQIACYADVISQLARLSPRAWREY